MIAEASSPAGARQLLLLPDRQVEKFLQIISFFRTALYRAAQNLRGRALVCPDQPMSGAIFLDLHGDESNTWRSPFDGALRSPR